MDNPHIPEWHGNARPPMIRSYAVPIQRDGAWPVFRKRGGQRKHITPEQQAEAIAAHKAAQHARYIAHRAEQIAYAKDQYKRRRAAGELKYADMPEAVKERKRARARAWKAEHKRST